MTIKNKWLSIICAIFLFLYSALLPESIYAAANTVSDINIVLSNISSGTGSSSAPGTMNTLTLTGKYISPGYTLIKLYDLQYLGASITSSGNNYYVNINGQTITFVKNSTSYSSVLFYHIISPGSGSTNGYTFAVSGNTETGAQAQIINGEPYVRLTHAANQCGALVVTYNSTSSTANVYHFRVNCSNPLSDSNDYIVGGNWLNNWTSKGTTQLAPHFKVNEIWDTSGTNYAYQMKISVASLQTEENVRYYYNGNQSITVTSGFRNWVGNYNAGGDKRSLHMRGRAIDAVSSTTTTLYNNIYNEFCGTHSTPKDSGGIIWYSWVVGTSASLSGANEMEKMPHNGSWWVHLGVVPGYGSSM